MAEPQIMHRRRPIGKRGEGELYLFIVSCVLVKVRRLLLAGADVQVPDKKGVTPLMEVIVALLCTGPGPRSE